SNGQVDSLSSRRIDLSGYSFADEIYMSFFYQAGGIGDQPDDGDDSLRLEFYAVDGQWKSVWPLEGQLEYDGEFHQVILPIESDEFMHENFRFRFQSVGNLTGMYDIWNIDYIYINRNRSPFDTSYPDRAINEPLSAFLQAYYTVPYTHYTAAENRQPNFWIRSLVSGPLVQNKAYFYLFNYDIDVADSLGNVTSFSDSQLVEPFESPIGIGETEEVILRQPLPDFSDIPEADSARVRIEIILDAEDNKTIAEGGDYDPSKYAPIDFRQNDTLRSTFYLTDYYAYDDGVAEAAAGLNFAGDFIAVQFELLTDSAQLTAVDMYFPFTGTEPAGRTIDIMVWQDENGFPAEVLHRQQVVVQRNGGLNNLIRYDLDKAVFVEGSYFVGYRQNTNGDMGLGLDLNNFSGERIFYNLDEIWEQNTLVNGSIMLRPVFGVLEIDEVVSSEKPINEDFQVWPNPGNGIFNVQGDVHSIRIYNLRGVVIKEITGTPAQSSYRIDLRQYAPGIYILQAETMTGGVKNIKLIRH
ncbi:MAG: T9SS type A sorting domain-containing protein, partial [Cyclobacteriaceae bacterium]